MNPGVIAVVIFYMLAGGVVAHIWQDVLPEGEGKLLAFYKDRAKRILPLYLFTCLLTLIFLLLSGYANPVYKPVALLNNIIIMPLNYYMYIDSTVLTTPAWNLIPPAWSLGVELQAYLLLPFVLMKQRLAKTLSIISVIIYLAANINIINTDIYGYRLLPGVFFMFLLGSYLRSWTKQQQYWQITRVYLSVLSLYIVLNSNGSLLQPYAKETLLGLMIGIPLLTISQKIKLKMRYSRQAGSMSYGIFLMHFLIIWGNNHYQLVRTHQWYYSVMIVIITAIASWIGVKIVENK